MLKPIVWWVFAISIIVSILSLTFFDMWNGKNFFVMLILTAIYFGEFSYINHVKKVKDQKELEKKDLWYAFEKVNEALTRFPGGNRLSWGRGINRNITTKTYQVNGKDKEYIAIFAETETDKMFVNVIYSVEDESIKRYEATYDAEIIKDPFHNFNPKQEENRLPYDYRRLYPRQKVHHDFKRDFDDGLIESAFDNNNQTEETK